MRSWSFRTILGCLCLSLSMILETFCSTLEESESELDIENRDLGGIESCMRYYPYTYHKCLKICSASLEPTCIDDQMCFCDTEMAFQNSRKTQDKPVEIFNKWNFYGVASSSICKLSSFCHENCLIAEYPGFNFTKGVLCESTGNAYDDDDIVKSCVCGQ